ncbi:MAG: FkbM family methyltransferase [Verrucomicrobiales bacterium]
MADTIKTTCRVVNYRLFQPDWDFKLVPSILERLSKQQEHVVIVQVGANIGNTDSDQIFSFLVRNFGPEAVSSQSSCTAILVEPVRHLYEGLLVNYKGVKGVDCENIAIAESKQKKKFYRLREGIDLAANGLPPWAEELGSFEREQLDFLWKDTPQNTKLREFVDSNVVAEDVPCLPLRELFEKHELNAVDFLQIDTEGYDLEVLKTLDFKRVAPRFINFERIHLKKNEARCREMLTRLGYKLFDHGQDTLCELTTGLSVTVRLREYVYRKWLNIVY